MVLFRQGVAALGTDSAVFATFTLGAGKPADVRFMLDCVPRWCQQYVDASYLATDPWLAYAAHHCEPIVASHLPLTSPEQREVVSWAVGCGFVSTAIFPVHSAVAQGRVSVLCLGSKKSGFFETDGFSRFKLGARLLATELHDWWRCHLRNDALLKARLTPLEIELLRREQRGLVSKEIAAELCVSTCSVNSRFQRLNQKMGVPNRRSAVRLAIEYGLLLGTWSD
jgi:DNA-binding CsgD family transcriptional regulator